MTLKVAGCEGEKGSYMRIPNPDMNTLLRAIVRNMYSECVWAKIIEQELILSVCLKPVCLHHSNECVMHDAKRGGEKS